MYIIFFKTDIQPNRILKKNKVLYQFHPCLCTIPNYDGYFLIHFISPFVTGVVTLQVEETEDKKHCSGKTYHTLLITHT